MGGGVGGTQKWWLGVQGFFFVMLKKFLAFDCGHVVSISTNTLKAIKLYSLIGWVIWYMNHISFKIFYMVCELYLI